MNLRDRIGDIVFAAPPIAVFFAMSVVSVVVKGLVLIALWRWFIVPALGMPPVSFHAAVGMVIVVSILTRKVDDPDYLWGMLLAGLLVERVFDIERPDSWGSALLGTVMCVLSVGLACLIYYFKAPNYIWSLLLIGIFTDVLIDELTGYRLQG